METIANETLPSDNGNHSSQMLENLFLVIAPVNLIFGVIILFLNSAVAKDYYKDRKLPPAFMFMIIAAVDSLFAITDIFRSSVALVCTQRHDASFPAWFIISYVTLGFWSYNISIFCNVVLAIIKSINLSAPFHNLEKRTIVISVSLTGVFWATMSVTDAVVYDTKQKYSSFGCTEQWNIIEHYDFVGSGLVLLLDSSLASLTLKLLAVFEYMLPSLIVLVCMVIQMIAIKRTLGSNSKETANEVNMTVFLVSTLYFICNSAYGFFFLAEFTLRRKKTLSIEYLMKYTLPLLNAALFPIILICRKESLRARYLNYWTSAFGLKDRFRRRAVKKKQYKPLATADPDQ